MTEVCIWDDGPTRHPKDLDGIAEDIAAALGAPRSAVDVKSSMGAGQGVRYVVEIFAPEVYELGGAS